MPRPNPFPNRDLPSRDREGAVALALPNRVPCGSLPSPPLLALTTALPNRDRKGVGTDQLWNPTLTHPALPNRVPYGPSPSPPLYRTAMREHAVPNPTDV